MRPDLQDRLGWVGRVRVRHDGAARHLHIIRSLVALFRDEYFLVPKTGLTVHVGYSTWAAIDVLVIWALTVRGGEIQGD